MIFVTVGTDNHDFTRLVKKMDGIAGKINDRVVMQIGNTKYEPKNARWFRFETNKKIQELYRKADIIVTHGGAGSIINSLENGKIPIVVPRLKRFGEHINDHQLDLARELDKRKKIVLVEDVDNLDKKINSRKRHIKSGKNHLIRKLKNYLETYEKGKHNSGYA